MGSLVPLGPRTELAPKRRHSTTAPPQQFDLAFDNVRLHGITSAERRVAIRALARLFLEAKGIAIGEDGDDYA